MSRSLPLVSFCRLSGESLARAETLFEVSECPVPGIYPAEAADSVALRTPLRVVQAPTSGFVQLAHAFDESLYQQYAFAGGVSRSYRAHLESVAERIRSRFETTARILEVGCGDGWLLRRLREMGFTEVLGIDPGRAADENEADFLIRGFFPQDLPSKDGPMGYDLVISRHVLEHIEAPRAFVASLVHHLAPEGELWIEVPDLDAAVEKGLWSNFYQLHCNYFNAATLDVLLGSVGFRVVAGERVDVFGGSLLRRFARGGAKLPWPSMRYPEVSGRVSAFKRELSELARQAPAGTVGYGAAERTAVTLGIAPELMPVVSCLYDGNPLLAGRYLAGTGIQIKPREELFASRPPAVLLFAISNAREILEEWSVHLSPATRVAVVGRDLTFVPLGELQ